MRKYFGSFCIFFLISTQCRAKQWCCESTTQRKRGCNLACRCREPRGHNHYFSFGSSWTHKAHWAEFWKKCAIKRKVQNMSKNIQATVILKYLWSSISQFVYFWVRFFLSSYLAHCAKATIFCCKLAWEQLHASVKHPLYRVRELQDY